MTARVLIVSEVFERAKPIERMLGSACFEVAIATRREDCLAACRMNMADVVLLNGAVPGSDAISLCRELKASPTTARIAVLVVTSASEPAQRLAAFEAGADECLSDPISALTLLTRVRSLAHWKGLFDDMHRLRSLKGLAEAEDPVPGGLPTGLLVLDPDERSRTRLASLFSSKFEVTSAADPAHVLPRVAQGTCGIALVSLDWPNVDGFKLCRHLRLVTPFRDLRLLAVANGKHFRWQALAECGIDDFLDRPIDRNEALGRVRLAQRKRECAAGLRASDSVSTVPIRQASPAFRRNPPDRFAA